MRCLLERLAPCSSPCSSRREEVTCSSTSRREEVTCYSTSLLLPSLDSVVSRLQGVFHQFLMFVPPVSVAPSVVEERFRPRPGEVCWRYPGDFLQSR